MCVKACIHTRVRTCAYACVCPRVCVVGEFGWVHARVPRAGPNRECGCERCILNAMSPAPCAAHVDWRAAARAVEGARRGDFAALRPASGGTCVPWKPLALHFGGGAWGRPGAPRAREGTRASPTWGGFQGLGGRGFGVPALGGGRQSARPAPPAHRRTAARSGEELEVRSRRPVRC
jgi:hypothetical protein